MLLFRQRFTLGAHKLKHFCAFITGRAVILARWWYTLENVPMWCFFLFYSDPAAVRRFVACTKLFHNSYAPKRKNLILPTAACNIMPLCFRLNALVPRGSYIKSSPLRWMRSRESEVSPRARIKLTRHQTEALLCNPKASARRQRFNRVNKKK